MSADKHWYRNAVIYALDVKTFKDSDGNGFGDLKGLISRLDHLSFLGVTCIWLLPFFPSPLRDNGYDVSDYCDVDPRLGTLHDFEELIKAATDRGMKVLIDLVLNHSSIEHPWFKDARKSRDSNYRNYYVWHDDPDHHEVKVAFDHAEKSVWEYSAETNSYYLHRFYKEQADLNLSDPAVRQEILKIMTFWVKKGVSGFRIDAAHMITDTVDVERTDYGSLHAVFGEMRECLDALLPDGVLMGEANVPPADLNAYFTDEKNRPRMHMLFNFIANKYTMLAFARQQGRALEKGLDHYAPVRVGHWVNFVRHHDELNTDMLTGSEREEVFAAFAPDENMRALHGVRRRLPPMLNNDRRRIELMYNVVFSLPGTPMLNYGEEIGMGDDLSLKGRFSGRTPMQWDRSKNGGFSSADRGDLYVPVIDKGELAYGSVNVEAQRNDPGSLLHYIKELVACRKEHPVLGNSRWNVVSTNDERSVAILHHGKEETLLVVHNLSATPITIQLNLDRPIGHAEDAGPWREYDEELDLNQLDLMAYGSRWIKIMPSAAG